MKTAALAAALVLAACGGSSVADRPQSPPCVRATCSSGQCGTASDGCGGTLDCGACFSPPIVDPTRLGVACPAPEVPVATAMIQGGTYEHWYDETPAGELVTGQVIWGVSTGVQAIDGVRLSLVTVVPNQPRLRVVLEDGRAPIFTPDHPLFVLGGCSDIAPPDSIGGREASAFIEVQYLRPGWCIDGVRQGIVKTIEAAPDGDVIRIDVDQMSGTPPGAAMGYFAAGLTSVGHNIPTQF